MTRDEFTAAIRKCVRTIPNCKVPGAETLEIYFQEYKSQPASRFRRALDEHVHDAVHGAFFPTTGLIDKHLRGNHQPSYQSPGRRRYQCNECRDSGRVDLRRDPRGWRALGAGGTGERRTFACRCPAGVPWQQRREVSRGPALEPLLLVPLHTTIDDVPDEELPEKYRWFAEKYLSEVCGV